MLLEAETNKYCPGGNDIGAISNLITWVLNFFLSVGQQLRGEFCRAASVFAIVSTLQASSRNWQYRNGFLPMLSTSGSVHCTSANIAEIQSAVAYRE